MPDITMPKLSDTMEEGKILRWLKKPGEAVDVGEVLVEVETDKADMEIEAEHGGVLREIRLQEGDSGAVGDVIAVVDDGSGPAAEAAKPEEGSEEAPREADAGGSEEAAEPAPPQEDASASEPVSEAAPREEEARASEEDAPPQKEGRGSEKSAEEDAPPEEEGRGSEKSAKEDEEAAPPQKEERGSEKSAEAAPREEETSEPEAEKKTAPAPSKPTPSPGGIKVSPLARTRAAELGIDPTTLVGSGPAGRVTRKDVEEAHAARDSAAATPSDPAAATSESAPAAGQPGSGTVTVRPPSARPASPSSGAKGASPGAQRIPLTGMRAAIARRMTESKREAPHFYVTTVVDMDAAVQMRAGLKEAGGLAASVNYNHLILKACADALRAIPEMNARFAGDAIEILPDVNLGMATAVPEGLIVPVIHHADRASVFEIATRARALAEKAKQRSFSGDDLSGATFSVSNLGMYDVESFVAVINPPQAGILAVGSVGQRAVVRDGEIVVGHTVNLTISCDHRAVDGARAAEFLAEVRARLENPVRLFVPPGEE